jgi:transcriptional regulator of acetoin/glycerol metabolism
VKPVEFKDALDRLADHALAEFHADPQVVVRQLEKHILLSALDLEGGNQCKAAERLGVSRSTICRQMVLYGIPGPQGRRPRAWLSKTR